MGRSTTSTHWTHVAMISLHTVCCGAPALAAMLGVATGAATLGGLFSLHALVHTHEVWILGLSLALVALGALGEWVRIKRGAPRLSRLFYVSAAMMVVNFGVVAAHRFIV